MNFDLQACKDEVPSMVQCNICFENPSTLNWHIPLCGHGFCIFCILIWFVEKSQAKEEKTCLVCQRNMEQYHVCFSSFKISLKCPICYHVGYFNWLIEGLGESNTIDLLYLLAPKKENFLFNVKSLGTSKMFFEWTYLPPKMFYFVGVTSYKY